MSDQTKPNAALAYAVLDQIDAHPEQWNQGVWVGRAACGTVACLAGWACLLAGDRAAYLGDDEETDRVTIDGDTEQAYDKLIPARAAELLGIPFDPIGYSGHELFRVTHSREDLGRLVEEIFGPRPDSDGNAAGEP